MYISRLYEGAGYTIEYRQDRSDGNKPCWGVNTMERKIILFNLNPEDPNHYKTIEDLLQQADVQYSFVLNNHHY